MALDLLCFGELTIDEISDTEGVIGEGSTKLTATGRFFGGRGANVSVYSSFFGLHVGLVGSVGNDTEGLEYRKHLASKGIDTACFYETRGAHTNKCFIFNGNDKPYIFFYGGALLEERSEYLSHIKTSVNRQEHKIAFCTSPDSEVNRIALNASNASTKVFAPSSSIYGYSANDLSECLGKADLVFLNQNEAEFLEKQTGAPLSSIVEGPGTKLLIKTLGKNGSEAMSKEGRTAIAPCRASRVVDANGAGDAFAAAFTATYFKTKDAYYSGRIASAVSSFVVEERGCQSRMPTEKEILERAGVKQWKTYE